jgi:hypothetical protein
MGHYSFRDIESWNSSISQFFLCAEFLIHNSAVIMPLTCNKNSLIESLRLAQWTFPNVFVLFIMGNYVQILLT